MSEPTNALNPALRAELTPEAVAIIKESLKAIKTNTYFSLPNLYKGAFKVNDTKDVLFFNPRSDYVKNHIESNAELKTLFKEAKAAANKRLTSSL